MRHLSARRTRTAFLAAMVVVAATAGLVGSSPAGAAATTPGVPTAVTASMIDGTTARVTWSSPASDGGSQISKFDVYEWPGTWVGDVERPSPADPIPTALDVPIGPAHTARFVVVASNAVGAGSPSSASAPLSSPGTPPAPTAVTAARANGWAKATVSWTPPVVDPLTPVLSYDVAVVNGPTLATVAAPATQTTVTLSDAGMEQRLRPLAFTVVARTSAGMSQPSAPSNTMTNGTTPAPPTNVTAVATEYLPGFSCVTVSWTAPAEDPTAPILRYHVREVGDGWSFEVVDAPGTATGCDSQYGDRPYQYVVESENVFGTGQPSTPSDPVTVPQHEGALVPGIPTNVSAALTAHDVVTVQWTPIEPIPGTADADVDYMVLLTPGNHTALVGGRGASSVTVAVDDPSTVLTASVSAKNPGNHGPAGFAPSTVSTLGVPASPTAVMAAATGLGEISVSWTAPPSQAFLPVTRYDVYGVPTAAANCATGPCRQINIPTTTVSGPVVTHAVLRADAALYGLDPNTSYRFFVRAWNNWGQGNASAASNVASTTTSPAAPTSLVATQIAADTVRVHWTPPATDAFGPVTGYDVMAWPVGVQRGLLTPGSSIDINGLAPGTYTFYARAINGVGEGRWSSVSSAVTVIAGPQGAGFHPLTPFRILDSRGSTGGFGGPVVAGTTKSLAVRGVASVGANAGAVVMNVTVTGGTSASYLTVSPGGAPPPGTASLLFAPNQTVPNLVTVGIGPDGSVAFTNQLGSVHVIADVVGWYDDGTGPGDLFHSMAPARLLDSRGSVGGWAGAPLGTNATRNLAVTGRGDVVVPAGATAAVLNVTATGGTAASYLRAWPAGATMPPTANVLFAPGQTVPNAVVVGLGAGGAISLYNQLGSAHVIVDIVGWFGPGAGGTRFHALAPSRLLDSRTTTGGWASTKLGAGQTRTLLATGGAVPAGASGLVANVTVTGGTAASYLAANPTPGPTPATTANLLFGAGQTVPNLVTVGLGTGGGVDVFNQLGAVHVIVDAAGWYGTY